MKPPRMQQDVVDEVLADWARERPDLDASPIAILGRLTRVMARVRSRLNASHEDAGLSQGSFDVLANLRRSGPPHRKTVGDLADSSMLTAAGVTFRLDRMEAAGLIRRRRSAEDRRVVYAELTDEGYALIDRIIGTHLETERDILSALSPREQQQLEKLLRKLDSGLGLDPE